MKQSIRVVIIDDHFVSRQGIISLLAGNERLEVVAQGSAGNHVLELLEEHQPDVLIVDLQMPADENDPKGALFEPVATLQKAIRTYPSTSVIVLSQEHDVQTIQSLAEVGVKGYLLKTDDFARILDRVVEMIHVGTLYFSPEVQEIILSAPRIRRKGPLTEQQLNVLRAIVRSPDVPRVEVAASLHISSSTLQKHITALFTSLEAPNMVTCVLKAMRMGLIDVDTVIGRNE